MTRCAPVAAFAVAIALALPASHALAQAQRQFPKSALRGELQFGAPPEVMLNGHAARLAPGARIRAENNLVLMSAALVGRQASVNYTLEPGGLVKEVWILTAQEKASKPWPTTQQEAQTWTFDFGTQTWSKP